MSMMCCSLVVLRSSCSSVFFCHWSVRSSAHTRGEVATSKIKWPHHRLRLQPRDINFNYSTVHVLSISQTFDNVACFGLRKKRQYASFSVRSPPAGHVTFVWYCELSTLVFSRNVRMTTRRMNQSISLSLSIWLVEIKRQAIMRAFQLSSVNNE